MIKSHQQYRRRRMLNACGNFDVFVHADGSADTGTVTSLIAIPNYSNIPCDELKSLLQTNTEALAKTKDPVLIASHQAHITAIMAAMSKCSGGVTISTEPSDTGGTAFTDPVFEVNLSSLNCEQLKSLLDQLNLLLTTGKWLPEVYAYYQSKQNLIESAYLSKCKAGTTNTTIYTTPVNNIPVFTGSPISGFPSSGGGGTSGGEKEKTKKEFPWWLVILIALGLAATEAGK